VLVWLWLWSCVCVCLFVRVHVYVIERGGVCVPFSLVVFGTSFLQCVVYKLCVCVYTCAYVCLYIYVYIYIQRQIMGMSSAAMCM